MSDSPARPTPEPDTSASGQTPAPGIAALVAVAATLLAVPAVLLLAGSVVLSSWGLEEGPGDMLLLLQGLLLMAAWFFSLLGGVAGVVDMLGGREYKGLSRCCALVSGLLWIGLSTWLAIQFLG